MAGVSKGAAGEVLAARFLRDKGYKLLTSNFRCRQGEIDIVAQKDGYVVFVEVKTRQQETLYSPREAVTVPKQRRLIQTAGVYLSRFPSKLQPRFDVIEVVTESATSLKVVEINHIVGAYEAGDLSGAF
ncbi:MAG: YraN family protein [Ruminococcaceae bacterium]|nr:YraN family protein [Oscillospiraceae bacterium]